MQLGNVRRDGEQGAAAVEYGLLVALIAIVIAVGLAAFGTELSGLYGSFAAQI